MTLTEFLLARLDEEEESALAAAGWNQSGRERATGRWSRTGLSSIEDDEHRSVIYSDNNQLLSGATAEHIARQDPARVLARCAADRQIVEAAQNIIEPDPGRRAALAFVCGRLASVYADHPDYREEWRL